MTDNILSTKWILENIKQVPCCRTDKTGVTWPPRHGDLHGGRLNKHTRGKDQAHIQPDRREKTKTHTEGERKGQHAHGGGRQKVTLIS